MNTHNTFNPPDVQEEMIDLRYYWRVVMQQKWNIIALAVVAVILTILMTMSMTPQYRATTTVMIESESAKVLSINDAYGLNTGNKEYFLTQFEILKSRELADRVIKRLNLDTHPLFDPRQAEKSFSLRGLVGELLAGDEQVEAPGKERVLNQVRSSFMKGLSVSPIPNTQLVKIHYELSDPELAAKIANTMADVYIESYLESRLDVTRKAADWLSARLGDLKATLEQSEERLQDYRDQAELVDVQGVQTMGAEEIGQLTQRYVEAQRTRSETENIYAQVKALGADASTSELMAVPTILRHPLVQKFREAQANADRRVAELSKRYGPKHPKMISAMSESQQANRDLYMQVSKVARGIRADYQAALQTENAFAGQLAETKKRLQNVNRKEFKLHELEREVETNRQLYDMFFTRAKETDKAGGLQTPHARIVDPALVPLNPVKPQKTLLVALAMLLSVGVGVVTALLMDALNNTIRTPDEVEDKLRAPMLGFVPATKRNKKQKSEQAYEGFLANSRSSFAESIRTIRTGLMLSNLDVPHKVTVVTSSVSNEGKSTVALNLAEAIGQMERVLLIDADMRRPTMAVTLGLPRSAPGLSNLVAGTAELQECIHRLGESSVDVIASGMVPGNPLELLSSTRFARVLETLSEKYDRIIIDSTPTQAVSDAMVLSTMADALIYVVRADFTPVPVALKGLKRLRDLGAPLTGVVLNMVDVNKRGLYDYYGDYYNEFAPEVDSKSAA
ncbi:GumC family protein [Pseudomaricurvus sp.]|uniref:GumC family protein n=1 Tax=Pseudomaricurvus sp. TaxID=2004510 RepID=UPI003F6BBB78